PRPARRDRRRRPVRIPDVPEAGPVTLLRQGSAGQGQGPVLIVGASSDIGRAIARAYAAEGRAIILAARDVALIEPDAQDLRVRFGAVASAVKLDVLADDPDRFFKALPEPPSTVVSVVGLMGGPPGDAQD